MNIRIGGTLGEIFEKAKNEFEKIKAKDIYDFLEKINSDINHFPEDVKKAINDTDEELKRFNINFNAAFGKMLDDAKAIISDAPSPEEFGKATAIRVAKSETNRNNCSNVIGGLLVTMGITMQTSSGPVPNPYAIYLTTMGPSIANWACSEVYGS